MRKLALPLLLAAAASTTVSATVHVVDCVSGPNFTINSVLGGLAPHDTVLVHPCTYNESVSVSGLDHVHFVAAEDPTLVGSSDVGVGTVQPMPPVIVDSFGTGMSCFEIRSSKFVTITGFGMTNCEGNGVLVEDSDNTVVHGNRIQAPLFSGVLDVASRSTQVTGNLILLSQQDSGVWLEGSQDAVISDNRMGLNARYGVLVTGFANNVINNDTLQNQGEGIKDWGEFTRIERNTATGNLLGFGVADILIDTFAGSADVVGNSTAGSLVDLGGGTELADNN